MKAKTDFNTYLKLKECIEEIYPRIEVKLISKDPALKELGLVDYIPCEIELCGTEEQINELEDIAIGFEIDALIEENPYYKDEKSYALYLKYTWIADFIVNVRDTGEYINRKNSI